MASFVEVMKELQTGPGTSSDELERVKQGVMALASRGTIAVDFDGVIHSYHKGWHDGTIYGHPIPGALEAIRKLQLDGFAVYVHTSRDESQVFDWLAEHGVAATYGAPVRFWNDPNVVLISNRKLPAVAYIDDRAIRFTYWERTLAEIGERVTP